MPAKMHSSAALRGHLSVVRESSNAQIFRTNDWILAAGGGLRPICADSLNPKGDEISGGGEVMC